MVRTLKAEARPDTRYSIGLTLMDFSGLIQITNIK
jgi:hypothetical protein